MSAIPLAGLELMQKRMQKVVIPVVIAEANTTFDLRQPIRRPYHLCGSKSGGAATKSSA